MLNLYQQAIFITVHITLTSESQDSTGWTYHATLSTQTGAWSGTVKLSFVDYERWGRGTIPPADVVQTAIQVAIAQAASMPESNSLDIARLQHTVKGFDEHMLSAISDQLTDPPM